MNDGGWIIVNRRGIVGLRKKATRPALAAGEYAVFLKIEVPDAVFQPAALPTATLRVPETALVAPDVTLEIADPAPGDPWERPWPGNQIARDAVAESLGDPEE